MATKEQAMVLSMCGPLMNKIKMAFQYPRKNMDLANNKDIKNFLNPSIKNILPNPNILKDMEKATKRTVESIIKKEKIGIFGDYDVDGASSTAILGKFFEQINCPYEIYIPDRKLEGYGPSVKGFQSLIDNGAKLKTKSD